VPVLPCEQAATRTHVIELADDADLECAAALLRDYAGWPP
jgi:hypothetical protein